VTTDEIDRVVHEATIAAGAKFNKFQFWNTLFSFFLLFLLNYYVYTIFTFWKYYILYYDFSAFFMPFGNCNSR
jgi:hypothetical protein